LEMLEEARKAEATVPVVVVVVLEALVRTLDVRVNHQPSTIGAAIFGKLTAAICFTAAEPEVQDTNRT
jgi:hypothetical protein